MKESSIATGVTGRATDSLATFGNTTMLAGQALRWTVYDIVTGRFPFREAVTQTWFVITVTTVSYTHLTLPTSDLV